MSDLSPAWKYEADDGRGWQWWVPSEGLPEFRIARTRFEEGWWVYRRGEFYGRYATPGQAEKAATEREGT